MEKKPAPLLLFSALSLIVLCSLQCRKNVNELDKLPAITQEGKRTFGCLVNGKAWVPENGGLFITDPPLKFVYENTNGGLFYITAQKSIASKNIDESITIGVDSCTSAKIYRFISSSSSLRFAFNNYKALSSPCITLSTRHSDVETTGFITISRFDLSQGIISGTFEFTLIKPGCETVKITDGRFDAKL